MLTFRFLKNFLPGICVKKVFTLGVMTICKHCGKTHGVGIQDMHTGVFEPIDVCFECLFKGCEFIPPKKVEADEADYALVLRQIEDKLIQEMLK